MVLNLICGLLQLAVWVIIGWIVLSYVVSFGRLGWDHPVRRLYDALSRVIEPIMRPIRSVVPPLRIGGAALDLSPIILILGISLLTRLICR
ncbi:MAG: YggT family protein [Acidimicrobiia bacterium]